MKQKLDYKGDGEITRGGPMYLNAGTVEHLHTHIWTPNGSGEVKIPFFKRSDDTKENIIRATQFSKTYEESAA